MKYIGVMSGTSLDAIDAVLTDFCEADTKSSWQFLGHVEIDMPKELKQALYNLNFPDQVSNELHVSKCVEHELTHCYAKAVDKLLQQQHCSPDEVVAIAAHGQTIRHEPNGEQCYSLQLLNGALLSYLTGISVVCDFRSKDIAAGGQGAPLAPLFHQSLFELEEAFAVINIGGISNISIINGSRVTGFDCGPGNCLLDEWIFQHRGLAYDENGAWAATGEIDNELLEKLLSNAYFSAPAPKSSGRDQFNLQWLIAHFNGKERLVDVMRTLVQLTAICIVKSIPEEVSSIVLCGGGAKNKLLYSDIQALLPGREVIVSDALGINSQYVEALGFAVLGHAVMQRKTWDTRRITGAKIPVILGAVHYA